MLTRCNIMRELIYNAIFFLRKKHFLAIRNSCVDAKSLACAQIVIFSNIAHPQCSCLIFSPVIVVLTKSDDIGLMYIYNWHLKIVLTYRFPTFVAVFGYPVAYCGWQLPAFLFALDLCCVQTEIHEWCALPVSWYTGDVGHFYPVFTIFCHFST